MSNMKCENCKDTGTTLIVKENIRIRTRCKCSPLKKKIKIVDLEESDELERQSDAEKIRQSRINDFGDKYDWT